MPRCRVIDNLYVGSLEDCKAVEGNPEWSVVHACKHPCHASKCGSRPDSSSSNYLAYREGNDLFLNMIDPSTPLFQREMFDSFIEFMRHAWEEGRKILIHCNQGESRAPTLAILFLAKVLYRITAASFDEAADEFELLTNCQYRPGKGLDEWMRKNWHEFKGGRRFPSMNIPEVEAPKIPDMTAEIGIEMVRNSPLVHFAGFTEIEDKEHVWRTPIPNILQFSISDAYQYCLDNSIPIRLIILKPRQVGCSTYCAAVCYHHIRRFKFDMIMMGDVAKRTEKVWQMFQDIPKHDNFQWDTAIIKSNTEKIVFQMDDGSEAVVEHDTALDPKAGISGTRQIVWLTEAARYMKNSGRDKKVITAVLNSLPDKPNTLCAAESTAEGASGWFYETWQDAVTLEQRKKGVVGNGWIKVFAAWFYFPEHKLARTADNADYFSSDLDHRERRGIDLYNWSPEQIAWRRMKIKKDCANDVRMFDQDFPEDAESCFLASGRPKFNLDVLSRWEKVARVSYGIAETGVLEKGERGGINFMPRGDSDNWLWVKERPAAGCSYIAFLDPCQGEQSEGSLFPDAHAGGILRQGYFDDRGRWRKPRLVAAIDVPTGCRWDDALYAERMRMLLDWYGGCEIIPETGNGLGMLNELRRAGCRIYQREKMDNVHPNERINVIGWETNKDTRPIVVNAITNYVSEDALDCEFMPAIVELKTFIVTDRGRAEAKPGCHDDWVMGIGIGLANIERATMYMPPAVFTSLHSDTDAGDISLRSGLGLAAFT
jgi:hypothetical protein